MNLKKLALQSTLAFCAVAATGYAIAATFYTDVEYYSDASYTQVVGERIRQCNGRTFSWGNTTTAYKMTVEQYNCAYPIP